MGKHPARCRRCGNRFLASVSLYEQPLCPQCRAALNVSGPDDGPGATESLVGRTLGELEIVELLGAGATTAVYRARQPSLNRYVAVKVLARELSSDSGLVARFAREALAAAAVVHPNVVQVHYVAEERGCHYAVMELVDGESLGAALWREKRLPPARALALMKQAAAGLAAAHAAGVVHGDVQPSNLLLTRGGQLKIADFSLAKCAGPDAAPRAAPTPTGAPLYFPPEAARGQPLDARSDLYLLGCTFYHALAGRPPFEAARAEDLALRHVREQVPPLAAAAPGTPPALCDLVHHLLQRNPDERFASAADLSAALERIEAELEEARRPPQAVAAPAAATAGQRVRAWGLILAASAAAIVVAAAVAYIVGSRTVRPGSRQRPATATPAPATVAKVGTASARPGTAAAAPAEKREPEPKAPPEKKAEPEVEPKAQPKQPPTEDAWRAALAEAAATASGLAGQSRFGEAAACYDAVAGRFDEAEVTAQVAAAKAEVTQAAAAACRQAIERARGLAAEKQFDAARGELRPVVERFGIAALVAEARQQLAAIDRAEGAVRRAAAEAGYRAALAPIEALANGWEFAAAAAALAEVRPADEALAARAAVRRSQLERLARLKARMIAHINQAKPKLRKSDILLSGINGDLTEADEKVITVRVPRQEVQTHRWADLGERPARNLALLCSDRGSGDDWVALALLALVFDDTATAGKDLAQARSLGADVACLVPPLGEAALAGLSGLVAKRQFREAAAALEGMEAAYGDSRWFAQHKEEIDRLRDVTRLGLSDVRADDLLARAAECLKADDPFEARRLLQALKAAYPTSGAVTDADRKPSFAELSAAVAHLGRVLTVRRDGKGDHTAIADAIAAAPASSLIEIQDGGRYAERLVISEGKTGLRLRGKAGTWPVVTSPAQATPLAALVEVRAPGVAVEGLVLAFGGGVARDASSVLVRAGPFRLRSCIAVAPVLRHALGQGGPLSFECEATASSAIEGCLFVGSAVVRGESQVRDSLWLAGALRGAQGKLQVENTLVVEGAELACPAEVRLCTMAAQLRLRDGPNVVLDSILAGVESDKPNTRIDYCNLFGNYALGREARVGKACYFTRPQFADPRSFDYRVRQGSLGRAVASDGGELGCRFTPHMLDILKQALELRRKNAINF